MKYKTIKILFLIQLLSLSSCFNSSNNISIFIYSKTDTFINSLKDEIIKEFKDSYYINNPFYAEEDQLYQNEQIAKELEIDKNKLFLVNLVDRLATSSVVEKANTIKKPVIFFNREPLVQDLKGQKLAYYVGSSAKDEGIMQAELAHEILGPSDNFKSSKYDKNNDGKLGVLCIKGSLWHQDSELRSRYALSTLKDYGYDINIVTTFNADWSKDISYEKFSSMYESIKNDIEIVISGNDDMALGIVQYLKEQEEYDPNIPIIEQYYPIIGVDATSVGRQAVEDGDISGTIINDAIAQAKAIRSLADVLLKKNGKSFDNFEYDLDDGNFVHCKSKPYTKNL